MNENPQHNHLSDILKGKDQTEFVYPPNFFQVRLKEEILRSNRTHQPFLFIKIPTRHFDIFGFERFSGDSVKAWKISVLTLLTYTRLIDIKGFLEDDEGLGVLFINSYPETVQAFKKAILRNLREAGLLEKIRLKPKRPLFEVFFCSGKIEKEHLDANEAMQRFNHINEGFFSVQPLNYSDLQENKWNRSFINLVKRSIDLSGALLGSLLLSPALLGIATLVKISDPKGPIIFKQIRVGKNGRTFIMYKFRSMYSNAEERLKSLKNLNESDGPIFKMKNDPRVTPIGRIIRKYSLDELPQLLNVVKGDMAIVGPRPPIPSEVMEYLPWHKMRLSVKPGLTCHWQVSGRSDIGFEEWMRLDNQYVRHGDLRTDMDLIRKTFKAVIKGDGAY